MRERYIDVHPTKIPSSCLDERPTKNLRAPTLGGPRILSTMHHLRKKSASPTTPANSPPPTPMVEYIKQELASFYPRTKDTRALAASSSAIALSIASPSYDPTDIAPDEPGSSKESVWRAAYGAAKIAVDIAKDSTDLLPPLKAVMVALSVLIKNYDAGLPSASRPNDC